MIFKIKMANEDETIFGIGVHINRCNSVFLLHFLIMTDC